MSAKISTTKSKHTTTNAAHKRNVFFFDPVFVKVSLLLCDFPF